MSGLVFTLLLFIIGRDVHATGIRGRNSSSSLSSTWRSENLMPTADDTDAGINLATVRQLLVLQKENQRLREINEALQTSCSQQHDFGLGLCNNIDNIGNSGTPSYALLEIAMHRKKLETHVRSHVRKHAGAKHALLINQPGLMDGVAGAVNAASGFVGDQAKQAAQAALQAVIDVIAGECDKGCFKEIYDATTKYLQKAGNLINLDYIANNAFENMKSSGLKKMMFGVMFHTINGLFEWAMPDIRLMLRKKWSTLLRPQFESKTQPIENALIKSSTMNIYSALQIALVNSISDSIHAGCQVLPRIILQMEIDTPAYCEIVIRKILQELDWVHGIVKLLAEKVGKPAVEQVEMLNAPIAKIMATEYKKVGTAFQDIILKLAALGGDATYLKQQATDLMAVDCQKTLLCKVDTLANLLFLIFDKRNVQLQMVSLLYKKMDTVLFTSSTFTAMFGKKKAPGVKKVEPKKVEPKKVEPKKVEPKKVEPKKVKSKPKPKK